MKYINPNVESSYKANNIGKTLYELVIQIKPLKIVEFGTLNGYSAISMAMALHELDNGGKIVCYDLWESYKYKHSTIEKTKQNIKNYSLTNFIELRQMNIWDWPVEDFDLLHLDVSNDGKIISDIYYKLFDKIKSKSVVIFEGGSEERDRVEWMVKHNKTPINSIKPKIEYTILNNNFPSISKLNF